MSVKIVEVNRPHAWLAKRGQEPQDHTCKNCGMRRGAVVTQVCFTEEVEQTE